MLRIHFPYCFFRALAIVVILLTVALSTNTAVAQDAPDLTRLAHPSVADRLELTDEQRSSISRLLNTRAQTLATTEAAERPKVIENINRELMAVLNDTQKKSLVALETPKELQFDFTGESWDNVLAWFAEQADLTLVHDKLPEQKFVYHDDKSYTTAQGIDLLNSVLLSKGYTLIRRGKLLIVADITERVPAELLSETKPEDLDKFGEFEFVKVRFQTGGRSMDAIQNEVKALVSDRGTVTLLPTTNQLLIVETAGKLKAINALIASIPLPKPKEKPKPKPKPEKKPDPPPPVLATYPYKGVDPEAVIKVAESLIGETKTTIDRTAGTISVFAVPGTQEVFKSTLEKHQANSKADEELVLNSYELKIGAKSKDSVASLLQRLAPSAQITLDEEKGRVTALGDSVEHAAIARAVKAMKSDAIQDTGEPTLEVYQLKNVDPEEVAAVLSATVENTTIAPSLLTKSVVVRASPKLQTTIKDLVTRMDSAATNELANQVQLYEVAADEQEAVVAVINNLHPDVSATYDPANERLVVMANDAQQAEVADVVDKLVGVQAPTKSSVQTYPVDPSQQANLVKVITTLEPKANISWDAANKRLVVVGKPAIQSTVEQIVERLTKDVAPSKKEMQLYPLENEQHANIVKMIKSTVPGADITTDTANERLIIIATPDVHIEVVAVIKTLTAGTLPTADRNLRVYSFPPSSTARATALIKNVDASGGKIETVDGETPGELAIMANDKQHAELKRLFDQLKQQNTRADRLSLQAYPIQNAEPDGLFAVMSELFPDNKMIVNAESRRLMAWATKDGHVDIKQAVAQLDVDTPNTNQQRLEAYEAPGLNLLILVRQLQKQHAEMVLTADTPAKKILAWGTNADHEKLSEKLDALRKTNPPIKTTMQSYPIAPRTTYEVIPLLTATVPNAWLTADAKTNTIIARATAEDHALIQSTIDKLPSTDDADIQQELITYDIDPSQTSALSTIVSKVAPRSTRYFSNNSQQLFIYADAMDHKKIRKAIEEMSASVVKSERKLQIYTAPSAQLNAISNAISYAAPYASVIERGVDRLSVFASPRDHERIAKMVEDTKDAAIPGKVVKSYAVQPHQSNIISNLLYSIAPGANYGGISDNQVTIWASETQHKTIEKLIAETANKGAEDKVVRVHKVSPQQIGAVTQLINSVAPQAVLADYTSDRITVWGSPEDHDKITRIIEQSKASKPAPDAMTRFQVYELEGASGSDLMELLEDERAAGIKMQISRDRERLIVRATETEHAELAERIPTLIQQIGENERPVNKIYRPKVVSLETILDVFDDLFPRIATAVDREGRLVSVTALPSEHEQLQQMFDELEKDKTLRLGSTEIRTYDIGSASGDDMQEVLSTEIATGIKMQVSQDGERLIVRATPEQHEQLATKIPDLVTQLGDKIVNKVYRPSVVTPEALEDMFRDVFRNIRAGVDENGGLVAIAAPESTHVELQKMFDELEKGKSSKPVAKNFPVKNAEEVENLLQRLFRRRGISISGNDRTNSVLVVAPPRDMESIEKLITELDSVPSPDLSEFQIYSVVNQNPNVVEQFLRRAMPTATIEGDSSARTVIIRGSKADQDLAKELITKLNDANERETKTYRLVNADPYIAGEMFERLAPRGQIVTDSANRTITVVAMPFEHEAMAGALKQMEEGTSRVPVPRTYKVGDAAEAVYQAVSQLYNNSDNVTLTWTYGSESILAVAPVTAHEAIEAIVKEVNAQGGLKSSNKLVIYPLKDIDGIAAEEALVSLLAYEPVPPRIQYDFRNGQMLVMASEKQHVMIKDVLSRMKRERREMSFFKMQANDAKRMKVSLENLFIDLPDAMRPKVDTTFDRQELMVQGSVDQMNQIRKFLNSQGEYFAMPGVADTRTVRVIPFSGDLTMSMDQIREVWPKIRSNKLNIVYPADGALGPSLLKTVPRLDSEKPDEPENPAELGPASPDATPSPQPPSEDNGQESVDQPTDQTDNAVINPAAAALKEGTAAPVVVIPGNGTLTIRSEDPEALNELEKLLRMFGGGGFGSSMDGFGGPADDVAVYGLRNAGAVDTAQLLQTFFKGMPEWSYMGEVIVIPDPRLNALVVHAPDSGSREMIETILTVLDSDNPMSDGQWSKPRIIPVTKTSAKRILGIIRSVYKSQLTTGSKRESIEIPQGLAPEVAAVLEQINAGTSGPVLTLEADEITNSIIVLAPPQLAEEVEALIKELDQGAAETERRGLRVIPLEHVRSELLEEVLQELSKGSPVFSPKEGEE